MRKLVMVALLSAVAMLSIQSKDLFIPRAYASTASRTVSPTKKKNKPRKTRKQKILKGRHVKHKSKPA